MSDGEELLARMSLGPSWYILEEQEGHTGVFKEEEQRSSVYQNNLNTSPTLLTLPKLYHLHHMSMVLSMSTVLVLILIPSNTMCPVQSATHLPDLQLS